jgi:hypothetical protein
MALAESTLMNMELVFSLRNRDQFEQCLQAISDPTSPYYGEFLNATSLAPYLPTPGERASVAGYLTSHGFLVRYGSSPLVLDLEASASVAEATFNIKLGIYGNSSASYFYASDSDPSLPENYVSFVSAVTGLDNLTRIIPSESPCSGPYCPQGVQVGYGMGGLYSQGIDGRGINVAITDVAGDPNIQTALNTFSSQYGLPSVTVNLQYPDGKPPSYDPGWASEAAMDVEAVHSVAPRAGIVLLYDDDPMSAIDYVAFHHLASIVSNSWTYGCPYACPDWWLASTYVGLPASVDARLAIDAALNVTIVFPSGDAGAYPAGLPGPEFPSSDPNVLAVGATNLALTGCGSNTCSGYGSESGASISGGGFSGVFSEPSWQTSTIQIPNGITPGRGVPDVSMLGYSPNFWVYSTASNRCGTSSSTSAGWFACSGTSLSTPLWAGFLALALQLRDGIAFGNIDPLIYRTASSSSYSHDFHDVQVGNNGFGNIYDAGVGWDAVTGWGSPIGFNLAYALAPVHATALESVTLNQGGFGSTEVSVTFAPGQNTNVSLGCTSLPLGVTCSFDPSFGDVNFTSTVTMTAAPWTPRGSFNAGVTLSNGNGELASLFLTVNAHQTQNCTATSLGGVYNCPLSFVQGWNLVSLPVVPTSNSTFSNSVAGIFGSDPQQGLLSNVTSIYSYSSGAWQYCTVTKQTSGSTSKYACTGTLSSLSDGVGYWVYAKTPFSLNYATNLAPAWGGLVGSVIPAGSAPPTYSLNAGWNLIGYKPQPDPSQSENITTYLQSITGHYDVANVWIYDNSNQSWIRATPATVIAPSEAMWVLVTSPTTLRP